MDLLLAAIEVAADQSDVRDLPASRTTTAPLSIGDLLAARRDASILAGEALPTLSQDSDAFWLAFQQDGHDSNFSRAMNLQYVRETACEAGTACPSPYKRQYMHGMFVSLELPQEAATDQSKVYKAAELFPAWLNRDFPVPIPCACDASHPSQIKSQARITRTGDFLGFRVERADEKGGYRRNPVEFPVELDITPLLAALPSEASNPLPNTNIHLKWRISGIIQYVHGAKHYLSYRYVPHGTEWRWVLHDDLKTYPQQLDPYVNRSVVSRTLIIQIFSVLISI